MKSPHVSYNFRVDVIKATAQQDETNLPTRRLTDITPASRSMSALHDVPKSPKIHELIERSKYH